MATNAPRDDTQHMTTSKQLAALKPHQYPKGVSGNPATQFPKPRSWYLKRYGIEHEGVLYLSTEIAKMFGISDRQVRNRVRNGQLKRGNHDAA